MTDIPIDQIKIGKRYRVQLGDLETLARSIQRVGLLHPVVINRDMQLIAGHRRLEALRSLGWTEIPARIIDLDDVLRAEHDENVCRLDFAPSEAVDIGRALEDREREKAKERQASGWGNHSGSDKLSEPNGNTRDKVGKAVGMSGATYDRAKQVVEAAEQEPEKYEPLVKKMDATGSVNAAYLQLKKMQSGDAWTPRRFNVWQAWEIEPFQRTYPGQLPAELLRNVLYYTTDPGDMVIDAFAGGGNMALVCERMDRVCISFDIDPQFENIIQHDSTERFPPEIDGAALVFLDPPYWKQKKGEYSEQANDLVNLGLNEFYRAIEKVIGNALAVLKPRGHIALIIGASQGEKQYHDHALEIYAKTRGYPMRLVNRVTVPYPTSQYAPFQMTRAADEKMMLNLRTDILIWEKQ